MPRRSTTPAVTLFPFLAVLVCTMGALILLLLVTTRQIRNQAAAQAVGALLVDESTPPVVVADDTEEEPRPPSPPPSVQSEMESPEPDAAAIAREEVERERREQHRLDMSEREREQERLDAEWRQRLVRLREEHEEASQKLKRLRARGETESSELARLSAELDRIDELLSGADEQDEKLELWERQLKENQQEIREQIAGITRRIEMAKSQQRSRPRPLQIVAFDPSTGTERKPILIECRSDSLVFASEGVPITAVELSGFTPDYNPLKAGTDALVEYWARKERLDPANSSKPYVLLVVRPGGTVGFYVARKMLEKLDHDFGYELVGPEDDIEWPERDPQAARVCREAVDRMLGERERLMANLGKGRYPLAGVLRFAGRDGEFHLQEVDELRNTDEEGLYIGGKKWVPPKRGGGRAVDGGGSGPGDRRDRRPVSPSYIDVQPGSNGEESPFRGGRRYEERRSSHPPLGSPEVHPLLSPDGNSGQAGSPGMNSETDSRGIQPGLGDRGLDRNQSDSSLPPNREGVRSDESRRVVSPNSSGGFSAPGSESMMNRKRKTAPESPSVDEHGDPGDASSPDWSSTSRSPSTQRPSSGGEEPGSAAGPPQRLRPARSAPIGQGQSSASPSTGRRNQNDDPGRRWDDANRNGAIGIERDVTVHVWADRVRVGDERELFVLDSSPRLNPKRKFPADQAREELQQQFGRALKGHVREWGAAPESFFWRPALKFVIHPGGNQHYSRLSQLADQWELRKRVEYDLE